MLNAGQQHRRHLYGGARRLRLFRHGEAVFGQAGFRGAAQFQGQHLVGFEDAGGNIVGERHLLGGLRLLALGFAHTGVLGGDELEQAQGAALNLLFGAVEVRAECVDELFQVDLFQRCQLCVFVLLQCGGCAGFEDVLQHGLRESDGGAGLCGEDSHELPEACPVFCVGGLQVGVDGVERCRVECAEIAGQAA